METLSDGLVSLKNLKGINFFIPSYQRGFRWEPLHITTLLDDLLEFATSSKSKLKDSFYCLQPIVLKKDELNNQYIVIDGQQRLTAIFLIYKKMFDDIFFNINYETRPGSKDFLENIDNVTNNDEKKNIDYHHMHAAYDAIGKWVEQSDSDSIKSIFKEKVKVISYEISKDEDAIKVFSRLNIGKIPLSNTELIKALFLSSANGEEPPIIKKRADVWYKSEQEMRANNDKAYCLYNNISPNDIVNIGDDKNPKFEINDDISRIEMLLNVVSGQEPAKDNPYTTFAYYNGKHKERKMADEWGKFLNCKLSLSSMANPKSDEERRLYHYIGFLICAEYITLKEFWEISNDQPKDKTLEKIKNRVIAKIKNMNSIDKLEYGVDSKKIFNILLLFNLESLNTLSGNEKDFEFNRFKMEEWSLEHIHSQNFQGHTAKDLDKWLKDIIKYVEDKQLQKKIQNRKKGEDCKDLLTDIKKDFEDNVEMHNISNLALLSTNMNSSLRNDPFNSKRKKVEEFRIAGKLIPHCTGDVFMKAYSKSGRDNDFWSASDRQAYLDKIIKTLENFSKKDDTNG